jgi:hypothetical protein
MEAIDGVAKVCALFCESLKSVACVKPLSHQQKVSTLNRAQSLFSRRLEE